MNPIQFHCAFKNTSMFFAQQENNLINKIVCFGNEIGLIIDIIEPANYYPKTQGEYSEGEYIVLMFDHEGDLVRKIKSSPSEVPIDMLDKTKQFIQVAEHYFGFHVKKYSVLINYPKN